MGAVASEELDAAALTVSRNEMATLSVQDHCGFGEALVLVE
jgi:hypothetical protein